MVIVVVVVVVGVVVDMVVYMMRSIPAADNAENKTDGEEENYDKVCMSDRKTEPVVSDVNKKIHIP